MSTEGSSLVLTFTFDDPAQADSSDPDDELRSPDMPEYVVVTDIPALQAAMLSASLTPTQIPIKEAFQ
jgi:hypothetical protein